jgi:hypothetical protein
MAFALGNMGMTLEQYAATTEYQFMMKLKGFKEEAKRLQYNLRNVAFIVASPNLKKGTTHEQIWPIDTIGTKQKPLFSKKQVSSMVRHFKKMRELRLSKSKK